MRAIETVSTVEIPDNVDGLIDGRIVTIKGEKGELTRDFSHAPISIELDGKTVSVRATWPRKKEASIVGTVRSHIENMIKGVTTGFTYKLNIVFSHFPITVKVEGKKILIENFQGERAPRTTKIVGNTKVIPKGEDVILTGEVLTDISQTAANIELKSKVKNKDHRVFLDGIYIYQKGKGIEK